MSVPDDFLVEIITRMNKKSCSLINGFIKTSQVDIDWLESYKQEHKKTLESNNYDRPFLLKTPGSVAKSNKRRARLSSSDEDVTNIMTSQTSNQSTVLSENTRISSEKPKRNASKMASVKISKQSHQKLNTKMRRPNSIGKENAFNNSKNIIAVKVEKEIESAQEPIQAIPKQVLNDATNENMPPPTYKPKRGRKKIKKEIEVDSSDTENEFTRSTRSKRQVKKEPPENTTNSKTSISKIKQERPARSSKNCTRPNSDVIIQEVPIPVITLSDSDDEPLINATGAGSASGVVSEVDSNAESTKPTDTEDEAPSNAKKGHKKKKKGLAKLTKKEKNAIDRVGENEAGNNSVYEDAVSDPKPDLNKKQKATEEEVKKSEKSRKKKPRSTNDSSSPVNSTVTVEIVPCTPSLNSTHVIDKQASPTAAPTNILNATCTLSLNSTHVIHKQVSPTSAPTNIQNAPCTSLLLNNTHVLEKQLSPNSAILNSTHVLDKGKITPNLNKMLKENGVTMNCTVMLEKINATVTLDVGKKADIVNTTMVLSPNKNPPQWQKKDQVLPVSPESLLTDDDDSIDFTKITTPAKKQDAKKAMKTKPMFSPYANSPVKKRVAAFEKLGTNEISDIPIRVTRTKTKMLADKEKKKEEETTNRIKSKYVTPIMSNKIPSMIPHTDGKQYRTKAYIGNKYNTSTISTDISIKSATAIKATRAELQERREEEQRRRLEKEEDARRKKEAMLLAKIDEQKRKREEKQSKAQKTREAQNREKDEKLRQMLQEKADKQAEEQKRKVEWAARKAAEMEQRRKAEEQIRQMKIKEYEAKKKQEEERMHKKAPPLPTEDCDDSDSASENVKPKPPGPIWGQRKQLNPWLLKQRHVDNSFVEIFYQMEATTPDLREIFLNIDERALRRNSSAVWNTPPRYSKLTKF